MIEKYFDYAATTPVDKRVCKEMEPYFCEDFGNSSSIHSFGRSAKKAVEHARERVAALIGAENPEEVIFTSGATESNNWVMRQYPRVATTKLEHNSIKHAACELESVIVGNDGLKIHSPTGVDMLSAIYVNSETGALLEIPTGDYKRHSDATQAVGKIPVNAPDFDYMSMSSHKMYGPKGVGALYIKGGEATPMMYGGGHERGLRSGTLNVAGIVGFGVAAAIALDEMETRRAHVEDLREFLKLELEQLGFVDFLEGERQSPYVLSVCCHNSLNASSVVTALDSKGFAISGGSACSAKSKKPPAALLALGLPEECARSTVRVSFGQLNTVESTRALATEFKECVSKLKSLANWAN